MSRLIIGHTTHQSVKIWARAFKRWPVAIIQIFDKANRRYGNVQKHLTDSGEFHTHVFKVTGLNDDTSYKVKLYFAKNLESDSDEWIRTEYTEGHFTTFKSTGSAFSFVFGSCNLHSMGWFERPDRAWLQMSKIAQHNKASFMLHCGDQIYADIPLKPPSNFDHFRDKYLDAWDDCIPAKKFLTELPHYMILDDHEIINNYTQDMQLRNRDPQTLANFAMKVYWEFQHSHNPDTPDQPYQYDYTFSNGTVQFFVMDTRYNRISSKSDQNNQMIDEAQKQRLFNWLESHRDQIKFIVSSVPFVGVVLDDNNDKWCSTSYKDQRDDILSFIHHNQLKKICFLTGDMHNSYLAELEIKDENKQTLIHELMSSPINQITPNVELNKRYANGPSGKNHWSLKQGEKVKSKIIKSSFYGNHSNVTVVEVEDEESIRYRVYRTSENMMQPVKRGQFKL